MKNNWTVRIIVATIVCFVLAGVFAVSAGEEEIESYWQGVVNALSGTEKVDSVYMKNIFTATGLNEINIISNTIDVKIEKSKDNKIHFFYYKKDDGTKSDLTSIEGSVLKFHINELIFPKNRLKVAFDFKNTEFLGVKFQNVSESEVVIQTPINIKKIKIKTTSGEIKMVDISLDEAQIESVSGNVSLQGGIQSMKAKTVSGDLKFISDLSNPEIKFSTVSGDAAVIFMKDPDVNIMFESTSGEIKFWGGLPVTGMDGDIKGYKLGKGTAQLKFDSTSGDVKISQETD